jgi:hypothetical protein
MPHQVISHVHTYETLGYDSCHLRHSSGNACRQVTARVDRVMQELEVQGKTAVAVALQDELVSV